MTEMGNWEFYDDYEEVESDEQEPSFSFYDFKKWLESNNSNDPSLNESVKKDVNNNQDKEDLKEKFKQRVKARIQQNVDKKLAERKKKRS
jgi:hypothetical protein